jgi:hypothetical protein
MKNFWCAPAYDKQHARIKGLKQARGTTKFYRNSGVISCSQYVWCDNAAGMLHDFCSQAELKRLYTQLEVLKNKTIRADNPHISKRRGGRKVAHRRFSLQVINPLKTKRICFI